MSRYLSSYLFRRIRRTATRSSRIERRHRVVTARRSTEEGSSSRSHVAWRSSRTAPAPSYVRATFKMVRVSATTMVTRRMMTAPRVRASRRATATAAATVTARTAATTSKCRPLRLLSSYDEVVDALCRELGTTSAGDVVEFSVYVFERGKSSEAVMEAMKRAARRGVRIKCAVDGSAVSKFTRWCEGSTTLTDELHELQRALNGFTFTPVTQATHAKFMIVERRHGTGLPSIIFGGVNVGDRFSRWRDFAIRAEGRGVVDAMRDALAGRGGESAPWSDDAEIAFATNVPNGFCPLAWTFPRYFDFPGRFDVRPAMTGLLRDTRYRDYTIAMAYIDTVGAEMLDIALRRENTRMTLVVPRTPNVYQDANRKAIKWLVETNRARRGGDSSNLEVYLLEDMLHAKVLYAESVDAEVTDVGMLGSCNLKQRSLGQFVELNASIRQPALTMALKRQLRGLVNDSLALTERDLRYMEPKATIEEWMG